MSFNQSYTLTPARSWSKEGNSGWEAAALSLDSWINTWLVGFYIFWVSIRIVQNHVCSPFVCDQVVFPDREGESWFRGSCEGTPLYCLYRWFPALLSGRYSCEGMISKIRSETAWIPRCEGKATYISLLGGVNSWGTISWLWSSLLACVIRTILPSSKLWCCTGISSWGGGGIDSTYVDLGSSHYCTSIILY